jgi:hypothetical protein
MTDPIEGSENRFKRLFKEHPIATAKAKSKPPVEAPTGLPTSPLAAAIVAAAQAAAIDSAPTTIAPDASAIADTPVIAAAIEVTAIVPLPKVKPPVQLTPKTKTVLDSEVKRGRGRPANGKRSDPDWFGRTFYIRKETDERLEQAVFQLKRSGIEVDKSQLADALLNAWAAVELGTIDDFHIGEMLEKPEVSDAADDN